MVVRGRDEMGADQAVGGRSADREPAREQPEGPGLGGLREGALAAALDGEPAGTRFTAREARYSSFKLWLKYAKPSRGTVVVDAGAARALRDGGTSLLPVGIVEVRGSFDAGDAVDIREAGDSAVEASVKSRVHALTDRFPIYG